MNVDVLATAQPSTQDVEALRTALSRLEPAPSHDATVPPNVRQIYAPEGHQAALDPDRMLVIGGRGTGKSFWSATLLNDATRAFVAPSYPELDLGRCHVALGFAGVDSDTSNDAPSREELDDLIEADRHPPEKVWRAIVLRGVSRFVALNLPRNLRGTDGLVGWVAADAARVQQTLREADEQLVRTGRRVLIVFDALDRLGRNWPQIRERTKALLQIALAMRTYRAIKPKIFMRVDQAEDRGIAAFPDASKLLSTGARVDLAWERRDLFGLLYTLLANDDRAYEAFAGIVHHHTGVRLDGAPRSHGLPRQLKAHEEAQARIFEQLAGPYMGASRHKGRTYTWLHMHLAEAGDRFSPQTFLEAVRHAATQSGGADARLVLPPAGLRAGIQAASGLRLQQLKEEYGWIEAVVEPLADQQVPCKESDLFDRWTARDTASAISTPAGDQLEPIEFSEGDTNRPAAILRALIRIGVAEVRADGRINIPDIYRVAARMLRKGGVPPRRSS